jgi:hypothetical protein
MRELTKSVFSASWAMSLFGVQQMVNLADPARAARAFDSVAQAAATGFDGVTRAAYETGDRLQRQMVDATLGLFGCCGDRDGREGRTASAGAANGSAARAAPSRAQGPAPASSPGYGPPSAPPPAAPSGVARPAANGAPVAAQGGWGPMPSAPARTNVAG